MTIASDAGGECRYEPVAGDPAIRVCVVHDPDAGLLDDEFCPRERN